MRLISSARARSVFLVLALSMLLAGDAWRYTFGWWTFGVLAVGLAAASMVLLVVERDRWRVGGLPYPLLAFLALATLSIIWSFYPAATALGFFTTWLLTIAGLAMAISFRWEQLLRGLGIVLRWVLGLSLVFELFVSVVLRRPILPIWGQPGVDYESYDKLPKMLYWSRNELFEVFDEGRIQGIVGNANHLGILALFGLIVFAIQFADRSTKRRWTAGWIGVAFLTLLLTRSATITVALVVVAAVALAVLLIRRARTSRARALSYAGILGVLAVGAAGAIAFQGTILTLLGKSPDLTGRFGIWEKVIALAEQRPVFGWGWVSYWVPWAPPFDDLAFRVGVRQLQAHNVWLDVWLQLGIVGLVFFAALVLSAAARSWSFAVDRPQFAPSAPRPNTAVSLLPLLLLATLLVQSVAESRLIVEYGWVFLLIVAVKTKTPDAREPENVTV